MNWGRSRENQLTLWAGASHRKLRVLWRNHDSLYIAWGRFRLRLMKPWR